MVAEAMRSLNIPPGANNSDATSRKPYRRAGTPFADPAIAFFVSKSVTPDE